MIRVLYLTKINSRGIFIDLHKTHFIIFIHMNLNTINLFWTFFNTLFNQSYLSNIHLWYLQIEDLTKNSKNTSNTLLYILVLICSSVFDQFFFQLIKIYRTRSTLLFRAFILLQLGVVFFTG